MKHTPGPWGIKHEANNVCSIVSALGDVIAIVSFADGRLIAAAPDLLDALKKLMRGWEYNGGFVNGEIDIAKAAIAKAEGK